MYYTRLPFTNALSGHRFDYTKPIEETVSAFRAQYDSVRSLTCPADASLARRRESWLRTVHRDEFVLCIPVLVSL